MRQTGKYIFFFGKADVYSNWHPAPFEYKGVRFNCVEQFMMYSKAMLFGDAEAAQKILSSNAPKTQKALGRAVRGFDAGIWEANRMGIVITGCREKFRQNQTMLDALLASGNRQFVEASPYDRIWGIGLGENNAAAEQPELWKGKNLLGKALDATRIILADYVNALSFAKDKDECKMAEDGKIYSGPILGVTDFHVAQETGAAAVIHRQEELDRIPEQGEEVTIQYRDGRGAVELRK